MTAQAQTGTVSSIPKICKIMGDDNKKIVYKNVGNNHAYPVLYADTVSVSGTEATVASGITFHGFDLATYGSFFVTPADSIAGSTQYYIEKNATTNVVKIKTTASVTCTFDVMVMIGADADIEGMYCRGNTGAAQCYP